MWSGKRHHLVFGEMADDSLYSPVVLDHLLVVTAALLVRTAGDSLAHHAVEVPLPAVFLASLQHRFEFEEKLHIFVVLILTPMGFGVLLPRSCLDFFQTVNYLLGPENPGLHRVAGHCALRN